MIELVNLEVITTINSKKKSTLHLKKNGFWKIMSDKYSDDDIERMDQRDKKLFDYNNVKAVGKERWREYE